MRTTSVKSTKSSTEISIVIDDKFTCNLYLPHDIIPAQLANQFATALVQIPADYATGCEDKGQ